MIEAVSQDIFHLRTRSSSYLIHILGSGQAEHAYYGHALKDAALSCPAILEKRYVRPGIAAPSEPDQPTLVLDDTLLEASTEGKGDYKTPLVEIEKDGRRECSLIFQEGRKYASTVPMSSGLPQTKDRHEEAETLELVMKDDSLQLELDLIYTVFPSIDAIARRSVLINRSKTPVTVRALASAELDIRSAGASLITFSGAWGREFEKNVTKLSSSGTFISESRKLFSSSEANPGFFLDTGKGGAYACNLVYSGPHRLSASLSEQGLLHLVWGMNPSQLTWTLGPGGKLESPEALMVWGESVQDASQKMRGAVSSAILSNPWKVRMAPLMLSTWDSLGYRPTETKVLALAKEAKDIGFEGVIIDDGWFGARDNENTSLGDWSPNTLKFPSGLYETAEDIHKLGLLFGLWFEPESVSAQSELQRKHPEWCIGELLDLTDPAAASFITETVAEIIESCSLDYIRWDLNRICQAPLDGAFAHKYVLALYKALATLKARFPDLYIETSSARFDLGMLSYASSVTLSRDTDPADTVRMVSAASLLYPLSVISTTVSGQPSQLTGRSNSLENCFNVSAFGALSYSLDLTEMPRPALNGLKEQIAFYKTYRLCFQYGIFTVEEEGNRTIWSAARQDGSLILVLYFQSRQRTDTGAEKLCVEASDPDAAYIIHPRKHLLGNSAHELEAIMESCSFRIPGDALRWAGIGLPEQTSGTGFSPGMRVLGDYSSRMYIIRRIGNE